MPARVSPEPVIAIEFVSKPSSANAPPVVSNLTPGKSLPIVEGSSLLLHVGGVGRSPLVLALTREGLVASVSGPGHRLAWEQLTEFAITGECSRSRWGVVADGRLCATFSTRTEAEHRLADARSVGALASLVEIPSDC